jgi:transcriptional regulator of acetoin/glycerol metabolism
VGALPLDAQIHLLEWLAAAIGRIQVVCTTPAPLLPQVRAGAFIDTLYYRLNTVYVDVSA